MSSESQPSDAPTAEARARNRQRFELELEFVQALANPFYLHSLAQQGIMTQQAFVNYLSYLQYWKRKEYARFVMYVVSVASPLQDCSLPPRYPHALHHLDLLQNERFRLGLSEDGLRDYLNQTQFDHWRTWSVRCPCNTSFAETLWPVGANQNTLVV